MKRRHPCEVGNYRQRPESASRAFVSVLAALLLIPTLSVCCVFTDSPSSSPSSIRTNLPGGGERSGRTSSAASQRTETGTELTGTELGVSGGGGGQASGSWSSSAPKYPVVLFPFPEPAIAATLKKVVDGDTVIVVYENGREEIVRLIGIDTPEKPGGYRPAECFGTESTNYLRSLIPEGSEVLLTASEESFDMYERRLAYIYRSDGLFINMMIAREGYAETLSIPPNNDYSAHFSKAVSLARSENLGIWSACGGADTPLEESGDRSG